MSNPFKIALLGEIREQLYFEAKSIIHKFRDSIIFPNEKYWLINRQYICLLYETSWYLLLLGKCNSMDTECMMEIIHKELHFGYFHRVSQK
jgi:hypothetical protein